MKEFDVIEQFFARSQTLPAEVLIGIGDDAAVVQPQLNYNYVFTTDSLIYNVHFDDTVSPKILGYKLAAVNLSDLAAMGATPRYALLALTLPKISQSWLASFSVSLFNAFKEYGVILLGGNTTQGPLNLNLQMIGVAESAVMRRNGAKVGDYIYVSGKLGAASCALYLQKENQHFELLQKLLPFLHYPQPRIQLGQALAKFATAAIDISDGLLADLNHITHRSKCGAHIHLEQLPIFDGWQTIMTFEKAIKFVLSGGEDYELCFTLNPRYAAKLKEISLACNVPCYKIGNIVASEKIELFDHGKKVDFNQPIGFQHFA